tara:strand:- start:3822 stop:4865 length:1044 start_codon:yes stop_codon:yes gene_type:complete
VSHPDYGVLSRLLHHLVLGNGLVGRTAFDIENSQSSQAPFLTIHAPVFVCGLARSGSTILLNALYASGQFRSLIYRDMPFVLASGTWRRITSSDHKDISQKERAHGDRIMINFDSPEAFEEIFWRTFIGPQYIGAKTLSVHEVPKPIRKRFARFVAHVMMSSENPAGLRYLSKNNNNILRIPTLKKIFPDAIILLPFRAPLQQAISLLQQHNLWCDEHQKDTFSKRYMEWLGHYEFGLGHKPFQFDNSAIEWPTKNINYWLQIWFNAYQYALTVCATEVNFLCYEQLCQQNITLFKHLSELVKLSPEQKNMQKFYQPAPIRSIDGTDANLLYRCESLYQQLCDASKI